MGIEIIKAALQIEDDLGQLATSIVDDDLRQEVLAVEANVHDLVHRISSSVCGVAARKRKPTKKLGRPPGSHKHKDPARLSSHEDSVGGADSVTSGVAAQP